jgi:hypothetical protein
MLAGATIFEEDDPRYFDPLPLQDKSISDTQWAFIEDAMRTSTADYLIVAGHYPVGYS